MTEQEVLEMLSCRATEHGWAHVFAYPEGHPELLINCKCQCGETTYPTGPSSGITNTWHTYSVFEDEEP